jgi:hypothetical protein
MLGIVQCLCQMHVVFAKISNKFKDIFEEILTVDWNGLWIMTQDIDIY